MSQVGLKNFHFAKLIGDDITIYSRAYTITTNGASTLDTVKIAGVTLTVGTDYTVGSTIALTAAAIAAALNVNDTFSATYTASSSGAVITVVAASDPGTAAVTGTIVITSADATTSTGVSYAVPVKVPGLVSADIKPGGNTDTLNADDGPYETASVLGDIDVTIEMADLPLSVQAALLGHTVTDGVMIEKTTDVAPYVAIMFESEKANGSVRYIKLLKGKFSTPESNTQTKGNKVNFQTGKITGKFVKRQYDDAWRIMADTDASGYTTTTGDNWYQSVA